MPSEVQPPPPLKLNLGCGHNRPGGWTNTDRDVDLCRPLPWKTAAASHILLEHVIEHLDTHRAYALMGEMFRVLRPGGLLWVLWPDPAQVMRAELTARERRAHLFDVMINHGHRSLWSGGSLRAALYAYGFDILHCGPAAWAADCFDYEGFAGAAGHRRLCRDTEKHDRETAQIFARKPL